MTDSKQGRTATEILEWYGFCTFCVLLPFALPYAVAFVQCMEGAQ